MYALETVLVSLVKRFSAAWEAYILGEWREKEVEQSRAVDIYREI